MQDLPSKMKSAMTSKLEKLAETFPMMQPSWVPHHLPGIVAVAIDTVAVTGGCFYHGSWIHHGLAGKIQDVHYVRNFLETGT